VDPETRDRVLAALGVVERKFNINQPRDPHSGKWVDTKPGDGKARRIAGGLRKSLTDATSLPEVEQALADEAKKITGRDFHVDMKGSDTQIAREHAEGVLQGLERYPEVRLSRVETYGPGGAREDFSGDPAGRAFAVTERGRYSANDDAILFNVREAGDPRRYRTKLKLNLAAGWMATGTPTGVALHEFGHVLSGPDFGIYRAEQAAKAEAKAARRRTSKYVQETVSMYAAAAGGELAAEAFADVMVNGGKASDLSRVIVAEIDNEYAKNGTRR